MASYINLVFDTTGPAGATLQISGGSAAIGSTSATADFASSDSDKTGYQIKVWGDLSGGPATEGAASWQAWTASLAITLSAGDGVKTINGKIRDDVGNETSVLTDTITLDTTVPAVTTGAPTSAKISKVASFNTTQFNFQTDSVFEAYEVRVVPTTGSDRTTGAVIPTTNGSVATSGSAGGYPAATNIQVTIKGADLEAASPGDGVKVVKVFVQDSLGRWSA